jgi:hypothetical protein
MPKHVGLMLVLQAGLASSQLEIAKVMDVAPSLVVMFRRSPRRARGDQAGTRSRRPAPPAAQPDRQGRVLLYYGLRGHGQVAHDQEIAADLSKEERALLTAMLAADRHRVWGLPA